MIPNTKQPLRRDLTKSLILAGNAESKLIGLLLIRQDAEMIIGIRHLVSREHFAIETYRETWTALVALVDAGRRLLIEYVVPLVADAVGCEVDEVSRILLPAMEETSLSAEPHDYAASVVRQWQRRTLTTAAIEVIRNLGRAEISTDAAATELARVAVEVRDAVGTVAADDDGTFSVDDDEIGSQPELPPIATMMAELDAVLEGGFRRKDLIVIGARSGVGKSSLCTQLLMSMAGHGSFMRYYFYEMDKRRIRDRLAAQADLILSDEMDRERLRAVPLRLIAASGWSIDRIEADVRQAVRQHGTSIVAVDHLHLMVPSSDDKQASYAEITGKLAGLAQQLDVCVILLAQFNRNIEKRESQRPLMSDFREAGSIEQDASVLLAIQRQTAADPFNPDAESKAVLHVLKNRYGECASIPMEFDGEHHRFRVATTPNFSNMQEM